MNVTVAIPDDLAARLGSATDLGRRAVEALALEEYLTGSLTDIELQQLLGFADRSQFENFLRRRRVHTKAFAGSEPIQSDRHIAVNDVIEQFRTFSADKTLGGLDVMELIREGRG